MGAMLNEARADMVMAPHVALFPAIAIFLTVLAFNLLGTACAMRWIRR
jgi:glutathione transport system permease protein